jgi:hypothetical protein
MPDWVLAAERAYVAAAVAGTAPAPAHSHTPVSARTPAAAAADADAPHAAADAPHAAADAPHAAADALHARAIAAAGAVASRYLAVGTPRSFGIVIDDVAQVDAAALCLVAHRTWFAPRDIRCAATTSGAAELASATGGRTVSIDEALACDIVNVYSTHVRITPAQLRRGTHINAVAAHIFDPELLTLAAITREADLPARAAGLVDGRQLDELTVFTIDGAPIAAAAVA